MNLGGRSRGFLVISVERLEVVPFPTFLHPQPVLLLAVLHEIEKSLVHTRVVGEFWVEGGGHRSSLPHGYRIAAFGGDDLHAFSHTRNLGSTDEDHLQRGFSVLTFEITDEHALADGAVDLASVSIAADADIERAKPVLGWIFDFFCEQDGAGAGAESWFETNELFELLEAIRAKQFEEGAGLPAWDHEAVDVVKLLGLLNEGDFGPQLFEPAAVCVEITLQG